MKTMKLVISLITLFIGATLSEANIPEDRYLGGTIKTDAFGKLVDFPSLSTDIKADIQGDSTTVSVTQTFINPTKKAVNAKYLFPLNKLVLYLLRKVRNTFLQYNFYAQHKID